MCEVRLQCYLNIIQRINLQMQNHIRLFLQLSETKQTTGSHIANKKIDEHIYLDTIVHRIKKDEYIKLRI